VSRILVTGAGGFVGGHLVNRLVAEGHDVAGVDLKSRYAWHQVNAGALTFDRLDASDVEQLGIVNSALGPFDEVYNLAANMGGISFIETYKTECMLSVLITTNVLRAAERYGWSRVFFASSACVYPAYRQRDNDVAPLREQDAYPAEAEDGYGWEKLFGERMHRHFAEERGVETRVARYHNVYGPHGDYYGGREKAPAAICRKVVEAVLSGEHKIDVWGDGAQTRSFTHVDDAIEGTVRVMRSNVREPLNVGSNQLVTIDELITLIENYAGVTLQRTYDTTAPTGVRGRNSDNALIRRYLDWEPSVTLEEGLPTLYDWVLTKLTERRDAEAVTS